MNAQQEAALRAMKEWLADEHELGRAPGKIEIAGEFDLHDLHYYIIKYKKTVLSRQWLLGVCGGYEAGGTEHCGHIFSEMQPYDPATAQGEAMAMVEMIRQYWMERAQAETAGQEAVEQEEGPMAAFVLLAAAAWDPARLKADLLAQWQLTCDAELSNDDTSLIFDVDGAMAVVSLMPAPVPDGEAEYCAASNYLWPEAVAVTQTHRAHLLVAVLGEGTPVEKGKLLTKLCAAALSQPGALGVYTAGTVFQPAFYQEVAQLMQADEEALPILDWVYFGLYRDQSGNNAYTYGLRAFGKEELEILGSQAELEELRDVLLEIADYVLRYDATLSDGETIGASAEERLPITRSQSAVLEGETLKIGFAAGRGKA